MKHTFTIWLDMKYVCIRLLKQLPNLKEYFLEFLPKTNQYNDQIYSSWSNAGSVLIILCLCNWRLRIIPVAVSELSTDEPHVIWWHVQPSNKCNEVYKERTRCCLMKMGTFMQKKICWKLTLLKLKIITPSTSLILARN